MTHALAAVAVVTIADAALLQLASLVARSEARHRCVRAAGGTVRRDQLYRVASVGYLGNIVNGELGFAIRVAALRRVAPERTPKLGALAITEVPIVLVEAGLAALVTFTLVGPLGLPWWLPIASSAVMPALALLLGRLALRGGLAGWWRGLSVLHDPAQRARMAGFVLLSPQRPPRVCERREPALRPGRRHEGPDDCACVGRMGSANRSQVRRFSLDGVAARSGSGRPPRRWSDPGGGPGRAAGSPF